MKKIILLLLIFIYFIKIDARSEDSVVQLREGNLALSTSQQPSPLFAYGQNIVDKGDIQAIMYTECFKGKNNQLISIIPGILYGVNDNFSLYFNIPVTPGIEIVNRKSTGIEDIYVQGEYAIYNNDQYTYSHQITLLGALYFPTGDAKKVPPTGAGSPSFFLGATMSHMSVDWYAYIAPAVIITTPNLSGQFGNSFFYQAGVGRNIIGNADGWIVTPLIELFSVYHWPDSFEDLVTLQPITNTAYFGPSIWLASKKVYLQAGILFAGIQSKSKEDIKNKYLFAFDFGWKFNS